MVERSSLGGKDFGRGTEDKIRVVGTRVEIASEIESNP